MQTSRLAQETAKVVTRADFVPPRQTRSFAASLQAFSASHSPLSSVSSHDIEDLPFTGTPSRKRKRRYDPPSTAAKTVSTFTSASSSPKRVAKAEDGDAIVKRKKGKKHPAKKVVNEAGEEKIEAPDNWEEIYDGVQEMRKEKSAPVDTMGCEALAEDHLSPQDKRFQTLIALMLSSQTKDTTNAIAMRRLQSELPHPGLTLTNILAVEPEKLNDMIYVVGFHNNKTRYIKAAVLILRDQFGGDIPDTIEGLMSLPGVGPKMAYLTMSAAWGRTEGIGVDVHVHRITNLWAWHKTKGPEETRAMLEAWLPREKWHEINHLLVGFGQTRGLCPSAVTDKKASVKRVRKSVVKDENTGVKIEKIEKTTVVKEEDVVSGE